MLQTAPLLKGEISLADWTQTTKRSALQDMLSKASRPGIISFALGLPASELFPTNAYMQAAAHVLDTNPKALQYGPPFQPLKAQIVALMMQRGVACREEQVFLTAGAQQGLSLLTRLLLDSKGQVITEKMTYTGFQQVIEPFQPNILTVPTDLETGVDVDAVESLLTNGARPAFIYVITDGHNPLGVSMSPAKRTRLVELAGQYRVPIIEDDPYGFLYYESESVPPMRALDQQWVFYVGSFSKILAPALRVGWVIVPEALIPMLSIIKEASDIDTSTFTQRSISAYLDTQHLPSHLAILRREYSVRRDTMLRTLHEHFPPETRWWKPTTGMFIWVELPNLVDTRKLLKVAVETEQVAFIPGQAFCVGNSDYTTHCMRLNFSNCNPESIKEGIARLARALRGM